MKAESYGLHKAGVTQELCDEFLADIQGNTICVKENITEFESKDQGFIKGLVFNIEAANWQVTVKQLPWITKFWRQAEEAMGGSEPESSNGLFDKYT
jgi:hypothetical protein